MDIVFHFHFYDNKTDFTPVRSLAFYVANINTTWGELNEIIESRAKDVAGQYGKHCGFVCSKTNMIGCSSSDIDEHQCVMDAWRTIFLNHFIDCVVSGVCDVTQAKDEAEVFEHTQQAYEQQQAQHLRDTLNANVITCASPAVAKKI